MKKKFSKVRVLESLILFLLFIFFPVTLVLLCLKKDDIDHYHTHAF